jgi:hypothetical protein
MECQINFHVQIIDNNVQINRAQKNQDAGQINNPIYKNRFRMTNFNMSKQRTILITGFVISHVLDPSP